MFLTLAHTKLDLYKISHKLVLECYQITRQFPAEEKFGLVQQIRRAAVSVHLNFAEGCSRKSEKERKRFFEISRGSLIEIDTAFDISHKLSYVTLDQIKPLGEIIVNNFKSFTAMLK
jgi:four helix bundle protein